MAKLNPLLLLGGAAAALFIASKKKGDAKKITPSRPPRVTDCGDIDIGGMKFKDVLSQMKPNPADNPPELQAAQQKWIEEVIAPITENEEDVAALKEDFYGHIPQIVKRVAPPCYATYDDLKEINEHLKKPPGSPIAMKEQDPRTMYLVLFSTTLATRLMQEEKINFTDIMKSLEGLAG